MPVAQYADVPPIGEPEAEDVEGVGGGMLAERAGGAAVEPAAAVAAGMVDARDGHAEMLERRGLEHVALEQVQRRRDRAGGDKPGRIETDRSRAGGNQARPVTKAAIGVANDGRRSDISASSQKRPALRAIAGQGSQFAASERADRIGEVELGPRK